MYWIVRRGLPRSFLLPILVATGCQVGIRTDITSIPSPIPSSALATRSPTDLATSTVPITPTPSKTATPPPGEVEYHCIDVSDDPTTLSGISGKIVSIGEIIPIVDGKSIHSPSLLVDLQTGEHIPLAFEETPSMFAVSSNSGYLAFDTKYGNDYTYMRINIIDSTNTPLGEFVEERASFDWLNDEILLLTGQIGGNNPLVALSPFESKRRVIEPFVTEEERVAPSDIEVLRDWGFYALHKIIYNPTLTRAIYASSDGVVFRDLTTNEDISSWGDIGLWGRSPKWSDDGTKLAIGWDTTASSYAASLTEKDEILILDENGNLLSSTHLSELSGPVFISSSSWSPDGSHVAFWYANNRLMDTDPQMANYDLRLAVYDTTTQNLVDYCIEKDYDNYYLHRSDASPIWSPDGNSLVISKTNSPDSNPSVIIVDLENERAAVVMTGYEPVGWMK